MTNYCYLKQLTQEHPERNDEHDVPNEQDMPTGNLVMPEAELNPGSRRGSIDTTPQPPNISPVRRPRTRPAAINPDILNQLAQLSLNQDNE